MDTLVAQVAALASQNIVLAYLIIYVAVIFLGNIGAFVAFWIAFQGGLGAWGVPFVIVGAFAANVTGDLLWYSLGRGLRVTRFGNWLKHRTKLYKRHGERLESHVERKGRRWMLFAKFAYGSNFPILFSLGWIQLPFRQFFRRSLLAIALWLPVILGVSYGLYASLSPLAAIADIKQFEIYFLIGLVLFIILQWLLGKIVGGFLSRNGEVNGESGKS
jgi:membrane protein DedA with SNARE-associated domain